MSSKNGENRPEGGGAQSVHAQLVNDRLVDLYQARSKAIRARIMLGGVAPHEFRVELQNAILDAYYALRPLRDENVVADYWEETIPSEDWIAGTTERVEVDGAIDEPLRVDREEVEVPYQGIDAITELENNIERGEQTVHTVAGEKTQETVRQEPPPLEILLDISSTLEDAAAKLGFASDTPDEPPVTEIDQETVDEAQDRMKEVFAEVLEERDLDEVKELIGR